MSSDDDDETSQAAGSNTRSTMTVERPVISQDQLYAPTAGYTFGPLPDGSLDVARSPFESVPDLKGVLDDLSGRTILRGGTTSAVVLVYQFSDSFLSIPGAADDFLEGVTTLASKTEETTVAGHKGAYFTIGSSHEGVAVLDGNIAILMHGPLDSPQSRLEQLTAIILERVA